MCWIAYLVSNSHIWEGVWGCGKYPQGKSYNQTPLLYWLKIDVHWQATAHTALIMLREFRMNHSYRQVDYTLLQSSAVLREWFLNIPIFPKVWKQQRRRRQITEQLYKHTLLPWYCDSSYHSNRMVFTITVSKTHMRVSTAYYISNNLYSSWMLMRKRQ